MNTLSYYLLTQASGFRCGITMPFHIVENSFADIEEIYNIAIPEDSAQYWKTAAGSISFSKEDAICGAIGESMERYCASAFNFQIKGIKELENKKVLHFNEFALFSEKQHNQKGFIWQKANPSEVLYGKMHSIYNNEEIWIPQELIGLGSKTDKAIVPSTSTGLAAHSNKYLALLRALEELLERDALTVYWLNSLGGREIELEERYLSPVLEKKGQVFCFDITQAWNPHPVIIVCGFLPQRNKKRISLGAACRPTYKEAIEKAYLEWIQGVIFVGYYSLYHPNLEFESTLDVSDFDEHAVYYTIYPELWDKVPLIKKRKKSNSKVTRETSSNNTKDILKDLIKELAKEKIRLYYKELTLPDVKQTGLNVVRVVSPELSLIQGDEKYPFLGGRTNDAMWRYPDINKNEIEFPNKYPHPLG